MGAIGDHGSRVVAQDLFVRGSQPKEGGQLNPGRHGRKENEERVQGCRQTGRMGKVDKNAIAIWKP